MKIKHVSLLTFFILLFACQQKRQAIQTDVTYVPPISFCGPKTVVLNTEPGFDGTLVPLFAGLTENFTYPITTKSKVAQRYFDQGLILAYGFNHAEAARSFQEATRQDPDCAMCFWGLGYVLGPNYNAPMDVNVLPEANEAIAKAQLLSHKCTPKEQALIKALSLRYPKSIEEDTKPYYEAYAQALKELTSQHPNDSDIAAMYAEALMDMHPWDLWLKNGEAQPWTPEIIQTIESVLQKNPNHAQAIHLYIHGTEASPNPERAVPYANTLRNLIPGSGHLVHMPSHTYINTGHYHEGALANERAVKRDSSYIEACHAAGVYPLAYYPHNWHFLAACAALEGKGARALEASRYMADFVVDKEMMKVPELSTLQHYYTIPWYIMVKFANWDEILSEPMPDGPLFYPQAVSHYARGMAYAGKGDFKKAEMELDKVKSLENEPSIAGMTIWGFNKVTELVRIAHLVLEGDIARRKGDFPKAIQLLGQAVGYEDELLYQEPPDWFFSIRHLLGQTLMEAGKFPEAEKVYQQDLKKWKENGWALIGLSKSLEKQGKTKEAKTMKDRYLKAWKYADQPLAASVL